MQLFNPPKSQGFPYISGTLYAVTPATDAAAAVAANRDYVLPFMVRETVIISAVMHSRLTVNAGDIYTGIYNAAGELLTNCAVDSVNTAGIHTVSTTPASLVPRNVYYFCANSSAASILEYTQGLSDWQFEIGFPRIGAITGDGAGFYKARPAAALLSSLDLTGWTSSNTAAYGGFVVA